MKLIITPKTRIGELLDAYPQLEPVLLTLSPAFARLRNPVLRKTLARVATLQQAAAVGSLRTDELVNRLRREVGQTETEGEGEGNYLVSSPPEWFEPEKVVKHMDASPVINAGNSPMAEILSLARTLSDGEILELTTPFIPAPLIDRLKEEFRTFSIRQGERIKTFITKLNIN